MTESNGWPRLSRVRALQVFPSVVLLSPLQARERARRSQGDAVIAVDRLAESLRAVADRHGWPNPLDRRIAERVDREWSQALIRENDIPPVVAADDGVWSFLALVALPDLARWRFPEPDADRYIELADHVFGRLWWRATVLGDDLIGGDGREPLSEDELVALFRRRDLVASPPVAQAIARFVVGSSVSGPARLALVKRITLAVLRESPMIELDALSAADLERLVDRINTDTDSDLGPIASRDGSTSS
jgi:hypothetical protein